MKQKRRVQPPSLLPFGRTIMRQNPINPMASSQSLLRKQRGAHCLSLCDRRQCQSANAGKEKQQHVVFAVATSLQGNVSLPTFFLYRGWWWDARVVMGQTPNLRRQSLGTGVQFPLPPPSSAQIISEGASNNYTTSVPSVVLFFNTLYEVSY